MTLKTSAASSLPLSAWHRRFRQQASWTRDLRHYLYGRLEFARASRILEVGCGTGVLTSELSSFTSAAAFGLDCRFSHLEFARQSDSSTFFTQGDAQALPYSAHTFDLVYCHYLLLWVHDPAAALVEMRRVTRTGGAVLALAEPDYGARIDYPAELEMLGAWQREALEQQGAAPELGRRLAGLLAHAGLQDIEVGVLGGQWRGQPEPEALDMEWAVLQADLQGSVAPGVLARLRAAEAAAYQRGERILFVPTFYAWGRVP